MDQMLWILVETHQEMTEQRPLKYESMKKYKLPRPGFCF